MNTTPLTERSFEPNPPPERDPGIAVPSLLYVPERTPGSADPTPFLADLHLDAVIDAMAPGPFQRVVWENPPDDPAEVAQRQDVLRDLQRPAIRVAATHFAAAVTDAAAALTSRSRDHYRLCGQVQLLAALHHFAAAVRAFAAELAEQVPASPRLRDVTDALAAWVAGPRFAELADGSAALLRELCEPSAELGVVAETVWADADTGQSGWVPQVAALLGRLGSDPGEPEPDASARPAPASGHAHHHGPAPTRPAVRPRREPNHVEEQALGLIAQLRPDTFARLRVFLAAPVATVDAPLRRLAEELRFFLGALAVVDDLAARGIAWCLPRVTAALGAIDVRGLLDVALALTDPTLTPVSNDLRLTSEQRVVFVTGPNQGGKTTLVRAIGQLAHLAALGLPVPAASATLPLHRPLLTHFPRPDDPAQGHGGLAEELVRLRAVLDAASAPALVIFNELLSTTSADDALQVSHLVLQRFANVGCRVLWVTFLDDLVTGVPGAASLVGQVHPDDPTRPTFRFRAQPPAGHSHAVVLAARFGLSADDLAGRLSALDEGRQP